MFPILLDLAKLRIALVGNGAAAVRRLRQLDDDAARHVTVFGPEATPELADAAGSRLRRSLPNAADLAAVQVVFLADLDERRVAALSVTAQAVGTLVHAEDKPALGTVHTPAMVRRGDLLVTVSTGGRSPGLAQRLKRFLEGIFGEEWQSRLDELARLRRGWRDGGADMREVARWTDQWVDRHHWLETAHDAAPLPPRQPDEIAARF